MMIVNLPDCPYYLMSRATLVVTAALKKGFAALGVDRVNPAYLAVLLCLWEEDGLKVVDLGRRAGLETSTMTGLLDRMERDGLVKRDPDPDDRRAHLIHLTDKGREVRDPVLKVVDRVIGDVFAGVSEEDLDRMKNVLRQLLINARKVGA
jgi:DNA-binding MarR family transcriptional regulator